MTNPDPSTLSATPVSDQPTPETDAHCDFGPIGPNGARVIVEAVPADFSRTLERQRDAARAELERARKWATIWKNGFTKADKERRQLRADLAAAREAINKRQALIEKACFEIVKLSDEKKTLTARAVEAERERDELYSFIEDIDKNYDCDSGPNGTHSNHCRCCEAHKLIVARDSALARIAELEG